MSYWELWAQLFRERWPRWTLDKIKLPCYPTVHCNAADLKCEVYQIFKHIFERNEVDKNSGRTLNLNKQKPEEKMQQ